mgnify:FL=1
MPLDETEAEAGTEEGETGGETGTNGDSALFKTVPYNRQEQKKRLDKARRDLAALGKINLWPPRNSKRLRSGTSISMISATMWSNHVTI